MPGEGEIGRGVEGGQTELFEPFKIMPRSSPYGVFSDKQNNVWFLNFGGEHVGTIITAD